MWEYNYTVSSDELYHYGVKGMRWGHRKARPIATTGRRSASSKNKGYKNTPEYQAKVAKRKKALKVGAAVVGTALAAYGTYKLSKYVQNKRSAAAMKKASDYINQNLFEKQGFSEFADGTRRTYFKNGRGDSVTIGSRGSKAIRQHNAKTISTAMQMYKDATNTKLDRGLSKVVNAGDSVSRTAKGAATSAANMAKRAATSAKNGATKAKNRALDAINPVYEYTPGQTTTRTRTMKGFEDIPIKETVTNYYKTKKRRG